jgi:CBS-domain-containing membrane protein
MRIHDGMSTGVVTANTTDRVQDIVIKMLNRHCGTIPLVSGNHELLGIVALHDVMLPMYPFHLPVGVMVNEEQKEKSACIRCSMCDGFPCLVNPSLTIMATVLQVGDHLLERLYA